MKRFNYLRFLMLQNRLITKANTNEASSGIAPLGVMSGARNAAMPDPIIIEGGGCNSGCPNGCADSCYNGCGDGCAQGCTGGDVTG